MFNILIIEHEKLCQQQLIAGIHQAKEDVNIVATLDNVRESIQWFGSHGAPDLIFMDVQLSDGLSFDIFKTCRITSPVVFTTTFNEYYLRAFEHNGIQYLLKPITEEKAGMAVSRYLHLQHHFSGRDFDYSGLPDPPNPQAVQSHSRILVKKGIDFISVKMEEAAYFFTEHKLTFLVTRENKKFIVEQTLSELTEELDNRKFFRANRQFLINVDYINRFRPYEKNKLWLDLTVPTGDKAIIISQENAGMFKNWIRSI